MKSKYLEKSNRKNKHPAFIKNVENTADHVQIAVRVPIRLKSDFEAAQRMLRLRDLDMSLTDVIQESMAAACALVGELYSRDVTPTSAIETSGVGDT